MQEELYELVKVVIIEKRFQLLHLALDVPSAFNFRGVHV